MATTIDLLADLGESFGAYTMGNDEELLRIVTSANVACGFHAGDPQVMDQTVRECVERGVAVGAHPSFPDLVGFGRRAMDLTEEQVRTDTLYQLGALSAFASAHGTSVTHLCPHGRLGNLVITRPDYARAIVDAVALFDPSIIVVTQPGEVEKAAAERGVRIAMVAAIDRSYEEDGTLTPRSLPGAVLHDVDEIVARTLRMVHEGTIVTRAGTVIPVELDSILLHGDGDHALELAHRVRSELVASGVELAPFKDALASRAA
ncbi:LamB/YcsF family protein [Leifsonia shinshuensis]|uniref:5-oxoprolinase subunit A n=1 Tax=Leifsonia shinshuensis TaxID=150026 RepID=A0A7G6YE41_9MICO|nr:5-oxoprolinase subunit PxpA [Leifsonia shinshuensis]QNE36756.1 5-oxoprolinase subunit PxpA [Leifsonia shinshuensis]